MSSEFHSRPPPPSYIRELHLEVMSGMSGKESLTILVCLLLILLYRRVLYTPLPTHVVAFMFLRIVTHVIEKKFSLFCTNTTLQINLNH